MGNKIMSIMTSLCNSNNSRRRCKITICRSISSCSFGNKKFQFEMPAEVLTLENFFQQVTRQFISTTDIMIHHSSHYEI